MSAPREPTERARTSKGPLGLPRVDGEARRHAIADPGPSWSEWFYFDVLKVWIALGFLVVDSWIAAAWLQPPNYLGLALSLVGAVYLEVLGYRALWYRPRATGRSIRVDFVPWGSRRPKASTGRRDVDASFPNLFTPLPYGRWTPEANRVRRGLHPFEATGSTGPDASEFL